jgi:hypothetical protein
MSVVLRRVVRRLQDAPWINCVHIRQFKKERIVNRLFKIFSLTVIVAIVLVLIGAQVAQALREAAAPSALPYGLTMQDTMRSVEQKLGQPRVVHAPQAGWEPGLPDAGGSPNRTHYWAIYRRFGVVVVYNSPSLADKGATIQAIFPTSDPSYLLKSQGPVKE